MIIIQEERFADLTMVSLSTNTFFFGFVYLRSLISRKLMKC